MKEFKIIKQLEYLIAFQNECLNKGDFENFDKTENAIKKLEEALVSPQKQKELLENNDFKDILKSLQIVSSF
jgi:hypothetical protein